MSAIFGKFLRKNYKKNFTVLFSLNLIELETSAEIIDWPCLGLDVCPVSLFTYFMAYLDCRVEVIQDFLIPFHIKPSKY